MAADEVKRIKTYADWLRMQNEYEFVCGIIDRLENACGKHYVCPLEIIFGQVNYDCTTGTADCKECLRKWLYKKRQ